MAATLTRDGELTMFSFPIAKAEVDENGDVLVYGKASDGSVDSDQQIIDPEFAAKAIRDWLDDGANVRVQHNPQRDPAGVGVDMDVDEHGGTWVKSKIIEPVAQKLVLGGALRAYSVGIARPQIVRDVGARGGRIKGGQVVEISLVDRPANKNCSIQLVKAAKDGHAELSGKIIGDDEFIQKALSATLQKGASVTATVAEKTVTLELPPDVSVAFSPADLARIVAMKSKSSNVGEDKVSGGVDRDDMPAEDFAGEDRSFPIHSPGDVSDAAQSVGRARGQSKEKIKDNIKRIAHRKGPEYEAELPDSYKSDDQPPGSTGKKKHQDDDFLDDDTVDENADSDEETSNAEKAAGHAVNDYQPKPYDSGDEAGGEPVTCPNCGKGDAADAKFCDQCGFHLQGADGVIVKGGKSCDLCHGSGKIREGNMTCPRCHGKGTASPAASGSDDDGGSDDGDGDDDAVEKSKKSKKKPPASGEDDAGVDDEPSDDDAGTDADGDDDGDDGEDDGGSDDASKSVDADVTKDWAAFDAARAQGGQPSSGISPVAPIRNPKAKPAKPAVSPNPKRAPGAAAGPKKAGEDDWHAAHRLLQEGKTRKLTAAEQQLVNRVHQEHVAHEEHLAHESHLASTHSSGGGKRSKRSRGSGKGGSRSGRVPASHAGPVSHSGRGTHPAPPPRGTVGAAGQAANQQRLRVTQAGLRNKSDGGADIMELESPDLVKGRGKAMCVKCGGMMKSKHKFCPYCGAPAGTGAGEMPDKTGAKKGAVPADTVSTANDSQPIPPHREPDGAMMEAYEDDNGVPDDDGATERSEPTALEEPMLKGDANSLALSRILSSGVPANLGILHDMTCPAFSPASVAKCYPQRSLAAEVDEAWWQQKALDLAASLPFPDAAHAAKLGSHATVLKSAPAPWLLEAHEVMHKAFSDANPGPGTAPSPASCSPGQYNRPYISAGHSAMSPAHGSPNSTPVTSGSVTAAQFDRGPLTDGQQAPSPGIGPTVAMSKALDDAAYANTANAELTATHSTVLGGIPSRPSVSGLQASAGVPNATKGRTFYSNASKDQAHQAMQAIHDHIAKTFPEVCAMRGDGEAPAQKSAPAPQALESVPAQLTKSYDGFDDVTPQKLTKKARKRQRMEELLVKEAAFAQGMLPSESLLVKSASTAVTPEMSETEKALFSQLAALQQVAENQAKILRKQAKALDELERQPDPTVIAYKGGFMPPDVVKQASGPVGQGSMADVAERTKAMMLGELETQFRTSADPAQREAAWRSILKLRGVGNV